MQKVHRRRNEQIIKDFVCIHGCGKAYGSYAALYTHIKNKHGAGDPSQLRGVAGRARAATGRKGRPNRKVKLQPIESVSYECRLCQQQECVCDQQGEIDNTISIMSLTNFQALVLYVGGLSHGDFTWVRSQQQEPVYLTVDAVKQLSQKMMQNGRVFSRSVPASLFDVLSLSSRYWRSDAIQQLFTSIFCLACSDEDAKQALADEGAKLMKICALKRQQQFQQLVQLLRSWPLENDQYID